MYFSRLFAVLVLILPALCAKVRPKAYVYRGPAACDGCPESLAHLLRTSPSKFHITYVGPNEHVKINSSSLSEADLFAQPGGGGISETWPHMKPHYSQIREFVSSGGLYLGTCLGAYFAGRPGYDFLGPHRNTNEEVTQPGSQVQNRSNTIIQVNWHFSSGKLAGTVEKNRWLFYQDGAVIAPNTGNVPNATILARYSKTGDLAALVMGFGRGRIGIVGPHPEAQKGWYTPYHLHNPDGIHFKYGWDLVETLWHGPKANDEAAGRPSAKASPGHQSAAVSLTRISDASSTIFCVISVYLLVSFTLM